VTGRESEIFAWPTPQTGTRVSQTDWIRNDLGAGWREIPNPRGSRRSRTAGSHQYARGHHRSSEYFRSDEKLSRSCSHLRFFFDSCQAAGSWRWRLEKRLTGDWRLETGNWKLKLAAGDWRLETRLTGNWQLETGDWKLTLEAGGWHLAAASS
jgi:hypothetical protein